MPLNDRFAAGLKVLGVYFLVQGIAQVVMYLVSLASVLREPYASFPFWKIITTGGAYAGVLFLAAFLCLRKTQFLVRLGSPAERPADPAA
ncbi:MAG: hypothetical protein IPN59_01165 [Holophaga sp.]|nr:hypothetical protein [Holophaga sp.]